MLDPKKPRKIKLFRYKCEECSQRFTLKTNDLNKNPYPRLPGRPKAENMTLCLGCRADLTDQMVRWLKP